MIMLQQMLVLLIFMLIGYGMRKKNFLNEDSSKALSWIVINIANPALILSSCISGESIMTGQKLLMVTLTSVALFAVLIAISLILPKILRVPASDVGVYRVMTIFSNIGFMGFPLISAIYGSEALQYGSVFLIPFNLLIYTYGIQAMQPTGKIMNESAKAEKSCVEKPCVEKSYAEKSSQGKIQWKKMLNIGVIACLINIILSLHPIAFPDFVQTTINSLSSLTAPVSMFVIGSSMANISLKKLFTDKRLLIFSFIKLIIIPIVGVWAFRFFVTDQKLLGVCMIMLATPVASMSAMLAQQYDGDYELASSGVALSTVLSVITMPLVSLLLQI